MKVLSTNNNTCTPAKGAAGGCGSEFENENINKFIFENENESRSGSRSESRSESESGCRNRKKMNMEKECHKNVDINNGTEGENDKKGQYTKTDKGKEIPSFYQFYYKVNENAKIWIKEMLGGKANFLFQEDCKSFADLYEERKQHVTQKYNLKRYINFFISLLVLAFVILDSLRRICANGIHKMKAVVDHVALLWSYFVNLSVKEEINKRKEKMWNYYKSSSIHKAYVLWMEREHFVKSGKEYVYNILQIFYERALQVGQCVLDFFFLKYSNIFKNRRLFCAYNF